MTCDSRIAFQLSPLVQRRRFHDLVEGVFNAIVNASISQMEAYADLVDAVAASLEKFRDADEEALVRPLDALAAGAWRRLATSRQQLLATMVMMGVNRIAVSGR